jgi:L-fuculose-phosphate aldolase
MPHTIYTEREIEELARRGVASLVIRAGETALTDLAREKAARLGVRLLADEPAPAWLRTAPGAPEPALRDAIVETGRILYQGRLMISNDGNISTRLADGNLLITPSGLCKGRMRAEDLLVINPQGELVRPAADRALKASSEVPMHLEVYRRRPDVRAVIHTHLVFANALAITAGRIRMDVIPEAAISFGEVPVTDFAMPATPQNAEAIRSLIGDHDVLLIRNHGCLAVGKNLDEALNHLERLEHIAQTLVFAELLGDIHPLPPQLLKEIAQVTQKR